MPLFVFRFGLSRASLEIEKRPFHFETTKGSAKMTMIQALLDEPKEKNWLYPKICRALYITGLVNAIINALIVAVAIGLTLVNVDSSAFDKLVAIIVATVVGFVALILLMLVMRFGYELLMLLFKSYQSLRESITISAEVNRKLDSIYGTQLQTGQYVCDSLATLCDNSQGDK